jgi:hypothetical protein
VSAKNDLIVYGIAGIAFYFLWKKISGTLTGPGSLADAAGTGIASMFSGTSPSVQVQGSVLLPNGNTIPISSLQSNGFNSDGSLNMIDGAGNPYTIVSGATPGTYIAQ